MSNAIEVIGVSKRFGKDTVLDNVSISFEEGKIHGIIGRNGSGKTVLMKCILGFLRTTEGKVTVFGRQIGRDCDFAPDTGMIIETPGFLPGETGRSNLLWLGRLKGQISKERVDEVITMCGLDPNLKKGVGKYSLGMRQRLGIAQAMLEDPKLLILDEPFNALDTTGVDEMRQLLLSLKERGKTIVLASHFKEDVDFLCDTVIRMDKGVIISNNQE